MDMPDRIWATGWMYEDGTLAGDWWDNEEPTEEWESDCTEYIRSTPTREHAEEMRIALQSITLTKGMSVWGDSAVLSITMPYPPFEQHAVSIKMTCSEQRDELMTVWQKAVSDLLATIEQEEKCRKLTKRGRP